MRKITLFFILFVIQNSSELNAQPYRWQQKIKYQIDVKMDVSTNLLTGKEKIEYINNSPDTLSKLFFHAYWKETDPMAKMNEQIAFNKEVSLIGAILIIISLL